MDAQTLYIQAIYEAISELNSQKVTKKKAKSMMRAIGVIDEHGNYTEHYIHLVQASHK